MYCTSLMYCKISGIQKNVSFVSHKWCGHSHSHTHAHTRVRLCFQTMIQDRADWRVPQNCTHGFKSPLSLPERESRESFLRSVFLIQKHSYRQLCWESVLKTSRACVLMERFIGPTCTNSTDICCFAMLSLGCSAADFRDLPSEPFIIFIASWLKHPPSSVEKGFCTLFLKKERKLGTLALMKRCLFLLYKWHCGPAVVSWFIRFLWI